MSRCAVEWARMESAISREIENKRHIYLLAERIESSPDLLPVGLAEGRIVSLDSIFEPKQRLHIHALYVVEAHRRVGIGRMLLEALLEWGRRAGCVEAELNVLIGNPARELYEQLGFKISELEMVRKL